MRSSLRAFGIGLFIAGGSMAMYEQLATHTDYKESVQYEQQLKEYEQQIAAITKQLENQKAVSEEENSENEMTDNTTAEDSNSTEQPNPSTAEKLTDENVVTATIYIYENVSIYTIGQQAEDLGIVSNGRELELYLSKPEYARSIQKGAFDLRSDMTIEQIAKVLTGQPIE